MNKNYPIDIVIPWVDGSDLDWLSEKNKYSKEITNSVHAFDYQDWDLLKYWFRGIESFAPWVNNIFFVTWGHIPVWLNTDHPKLKIVNHKDFIPNEYLPTFSANPIELNFHRIEGLSEHFVYFNDDMYLISPTKRKDFFKTGKPCDSAVINPIAPANNNCIAHMQLTNAAVINQHFSKHRVIMNNCFKWFNVKYYELLPLNALFVPWSRFPGFLEKHLPTSFLKSTFNDVWKEEFDLLDGTCKHRFRDYKTDVNQWLIKEWQIASGNFKPRSIHVGKLCPISDMNSAEKVCAEILDQKYKMICINDHVENENYLEIASVVRTAFDSILPNKSMFEK